MDAREFRDQVYRSFGRRLENLTPDGVREFTARFYAGLDTVDADGRYDLGDGPLDTPEGVVKRFLVDSLESDSEQARQQLWVTLLDLWFAVFEVDESERMERLFGDLPPPE